MKNMSLISIYFLGHSVEHHQYSYFWVPIIQLHLQFNNNYFQTQMDPFYFSFYTCPPSDYSYFTFCEYPIHSLDYFQFNTTPSLTILEDFNANGYTQNKNYVTNTENVKVQEVESEAKKIDIHQNRNLDENPNQMSSEIRYQMKVNSGHKINYNKSLKVKYFDPTQAPVMTSSRYYDIQNSIEPKLTYNTESTINQLDFVQEDSCPFIIERHKNIKKKYKMYLNKQKQEVGSGSQEIYSEMGSSHCFHHYKGEQGMQPQGEQWVGQSRSMCRQVEQRQQKHIQKKRRTEINQNQIKCYKKQIKNKKFGNRKTDSV